jgi:hypothetical protein
MVFLCLPVFSQEQFVADVEEIYVINSFVFNIDGITRPSALINNNGFKEGEEISGLSNLENYIQEKTQLLYNQRVLESAAIEYYIGVMRNDGKYPVDLVINVKDTKNFVILPGPKYSSNSGFSIEISIQHYNFFGTMSPFKIDVGYKHDEQGRSNYLFSLDSNVPFRAFDLNWNLSFINDFEYRPHLENLLYYKNTTGLYVNLPLGRFVATLGFCESVIINEESLSFDGNIHNDIDSIHFGPSIGVGRVDWIGNFQNGLYANIIQSYSYTFHNKEFDKSPWGVYHEISGIAHVFSGFFFGVSSRLMLRHWTFPNVYYNAGDTLRGILDKDVHSNYMLSLNIDVPFRILKFRPSEWFNNTKLQFFNFDLHLAPVIDAALYNNPPNGNQFTFENMLASGGLEAVIFPQRFRSLLVRVSFGVNLKGPSNAGKYELFIGTDLFY